MIAATLDLDGAGSVLWDVLVIGAGPAGSLAGRQLAEGGARVLLVDRKPFPRAKVCGACLNGKALAVLESVGLSDRINRLGGIALDRFEIRHASRSAGFPLPAGQAIAREPFDAALVEAAIEAGAAFLPATNATILPGGVEARTARLATRDRWLSVRARIVIAASGLAGLSFDQEPGHRSRISAASRIGVSCALKTDSEAFDEGTIYMAVGPSGYLGLVRVEGSRLNIASAFDRAFLRDSGGPAEAASIVLQEAGFAPLPGLARVRWRGTVPLTRWSRPLAGHRLFLIGDAAGYIEPFTGEGMGVALSSARAVAPLARRGASKWEGSLAREWSRRYHRLAGRGQILTRGLAMATRSPWAVRGLLGLSARWPQLAGALIQRLNEPPDFL